MTFQSTPPDRPAVFPAPVFSDGTSQRIPLRRSVALRFARAFFILTAAWALFTCCAAHLGVAQAVPLTLSGVAVLLIAAARYESAAPAELKIGAEGVSVWDSQGRLQAHGAIAGCSQWSGRLLILALVHRPGRTRTVVLAADALPAEAFRRLAVQGRRAAGA